MAKKQTGKKLPPPPTNRKAHQGPGVMARLADWSRTDAGKHTVRLGLVASAFVLAGAGAGYGLHRVDTYASGVIAQSDAVSVRIAWPGAPEADGATAETWLPASEQRRLRTLALEAIVRSEAVLDGSSVRDASAALLATGWFTEAPRVRWRTKNEAEIDGVWRAPAAVVRHDGRERLIAWDGVPLPLEYDIGHSGVRYLDEPFRGPPRVSEGPHAAWRGEDVAGGLRLLEMLQRDEAVYKQVAGVDLNGGRELEIVTDKGTRVVWGSPPEQFAPGEQPDDIKLARLRALVDAQGRIDGGRAWISIRGGEVLVGDAAP